MKDKLMELCWNYLHTVTLYHDDMPNEPFKQVVFKNEIPEITEKILSLIKSNMPKKIENIIETCCTCDCYKSGRNKAIDDCIKVMGL